MRDDEGYQGNPPCQPASAYFSPLALCDQYSIPRRAPGPNAAPFCPPRHPLCPRPPAAPRRTLPPRLLLLTCLSTCALPSTVTNQPPSHPPFASPPVISRFPSTFIFGCVFLRCSLSPSSPSSLPHLDEFVSKISFYATLCT